MSLLAAISLCVPASAHELPPGIAELSRQADSLVVSLRVDLEALLTGIELGSDSDDDVDYDRLRALAPEALEARVRRWAPALLDGIDVQDEVGGALHLRIDEVAIPEVGDVRQSRPGQVTLVAPWPSAAQALQVGWQRGFGALIVRAGAAEELDAFGAYVLPGELSPAIALPVIAGRAGAAAQPALDTFVDYVRIGFVHIVPRGLDHILFVVALFLLSPRIGAIAWQVSAFTLAHSLTLAAGALGYLALPASVVEPLIALSIALVALENLFVRRVHAYRLALVFGFGLLHGLGFAGVLGEVGVSANRFLLSLFAFNAGVEIGQLCVVAVCFALVGWIRDAPGYRRVVVVPGSVCVGAIGLFWFVQRLVA